MHIPIITSHIMICPHNIEIHLPVIRSFQEAVIQATLQEWSVIKPVPIKDECINSMIGSHINPTLHHFRVIIQFISPQWDLRLIMTGKTRISFLDNLPLTRTILPQHLSSHRIVMTRWPNISSHSIFRRHVTILIS